jgi:peptidoglycan/xylan/chitin deacetylase (PgdA/CDA1 family)
MVPRLRRIALRALLATHLVATLQRNGQWRGPIVKSFSTRAREVWLTIDDGPTRRDTNDLLDLLAAYDARATFFVIGRNALRHQATTRRMLAEGHTIGNHTFSHPSGHWWALPPAMVFDEIARGSHAIRMATGTEPKLFRAPIGMFPPGTHRAAANLGMDIIGWSADGRDGCPSPPHAVANHLAKDLKPGAILLVHEGGTSRRRAAALRNTLNLLAAENFRCVVPDRAQFVR